MRFQRAGFQLIAPPDLALVDLVQASRSERSCLRLAREALSAGMRLQPAARLWRVSSLLCCWQRSCTYRDF